MRPCRFEHVLAVFAEVPQRQLLAGILVLACDRVDGFDAGGVHDAGVSKVDDDMRWVPVDRERIEETRGGAEEKRPFEFVDFRAVLLDEGTRIDAGMFPGKDQGGDDDAGDDGDGQVLDDGDDRDGDHDDGIGAGHVLEVAETAPLEGADADHEHDPDEYGDRDDVKDVGQRRDENHEADGGGDARKPSETAGGVVDDGLTDHCTARHPTEEAAGHVAGPERDTLLVAAASRAAHLIQYRQRQQRFDQPDEGHDDAVGQDGQDCIVAEDEVGNVESRQVAFELGEVRHVADGAGLKAEEVGDKRQRDDGDEARRNRFRVARQQEHDRHCDPDEQVHEDAFAGKELELRHRDDDGQAVDEAVHRRLRHEADEFAHFENAEKHLDQSGQHGGERDILQDAPGECFAGQSLFLQEAGDFEGQADEHDGDGAGRPADHPGFAADERRDKPEDEGGVEPDDGADFGDKGEGDRLGDEGDGDDEPGEDVIFEVVGAVILEREHHTPCSDSSWSRILRCLFCASTRASRLVATTSSGALATKRSLLSMPASFAISFSSFTFCFSRRSMMGARSMEPVGIKTSTFSPTSLTAFSIFSVTKPTFSTLPRRQM